MKHTTEKALKEIKRRARIIHKKTIERRQTFWRQQPALR